MNRDYRRNSADGGIALGGGPDCEIQFCLPPRTAGNSTTGINRERNIRFIIPPMESPVPMKHR